MQLRREIMQLVIELPDELVSEIQVIIGKQDITEFVEQAIIDMLNTEQCQPQPRNF
jgi:hypothetical protein